MKNSFARSFLQVIALLIGLAVASFWRDHHNLLTNYPRLVSTKAHLGLGVNGAQSFLRTPVSLAGGSLNLGAWFGHQEIALDKTWSSFPSVSLRVRAEPGSELEVEFQPAHGEKTVLRLSSRTEHPSAWLAVDEEGNFARKQPFHVALRQGKWQRLKMETQGTSIRATLDGETLPPFPAPSAPLRVLLRGDSAAGSIRVNNLALAAGDEKFEQNFSGEIPWLLFLVVTLVTSLLFYALEKLSEPKIAAFAGGALFLVIGGIIALYGGGRYPVNVDLGGVPSHIETREQALGRITALTPFRKPVVLWLGGSQSWGAGASAEERTAFSRLRRVLADRGYSWVNGAISGARVAEQRAVISAVKSLPAGSLVVLTTGVNDAENSHFPADLEKTMAAARATGARVLLLPEATEPPAEGMVAKRQAEVLEFARKNSLSTFSQQPEFDKHADDGFLWWDFVHLSDAGARFQAGLLEAVIREQLGSVD
ncbi:MAG: SGNH/GDSL hydrolase family protein [Bdellovibrionota bacterium]